MPVICLAFKTVAESRFEKLVQWFSGKAVHVEIVPLNPHVMFTSFMFETFSLNKYAPYDRSKYEIFRIEVDDEELEKITKMLLLFVEKQIPYNYMDILKIGTNISLYDDEDYENVDEIESLFCSQAITYVLKHCLNSTNKLSSQIKNLNSRFTTPLVLYDITKNVLCSDDSLYINFPQHQNGLA